MHQLLTLPHMPLKTAVRSSIMWSAKRTSSHELVYMKNYMQLVIAIGNDMLSRIECLCSRTHKGRLVLAWMLRCSAVKIE